MNIEIIRNGMKQLTIKELLQNCGVGWNYEKEELRRRLDEMAAEIESLKCCGNCKHFVYDKEADEQIYCENDVYPFLIVGRCDKWEGR